MKTLNDWLPLAVLAWPLGLVLLVLLLSGCATTLTGTPAPLAHDNMAGVTYYADAWRPPPLPRCTHDARYCDIRETPEDGLRLTVRWYDVARELFGG